jgi:TRAP-type C4-dicarboxylate transport system substrate-binding protein
MGGRDTNAARLVAVALGASLALAGCATSAAGDRSGGDTVHLQLATIDDGGVGLGEAFVRELGTVSGGRITADVSLNYGEGAPDAESRLVSAIASGEIDGGWPATRAFAEAGIRGLAAVDAPLRITSDDAVDALVSGSADERIRETLEGTGVAALALQADDLRRPFSVTDPLVDLEDWQGTTFRTFNSPVQTATVKALGATPVRAGVLWKDQIADGTLDGGEYAVRYFEGSDWVATPNTPWSLPTNVVLWPKVAVISLSRQRFDSLTGPQQAWVREAAANASREVSAQLSAQTQSQQAQQMCADGVRFEAATTEQLAGLVKAVEPVVQGLREDPAEKALMAIVDGIAAEHADADALDVPMPCPAPTVVAATPSGPPSAATIQDGVYRTEIPATRVKEAGVSNAGGWSGTWTRTIHDGTYAVTCTPVDDPGVDCGHSVTDMVLEAGNLQYSGDTVTFVYDRDVHAAHGCEPYCHPLPPYSARWTQSGDVLTFTDSTDASLVLEPWRKID